MSPIVKSPPEKMDEIPTYDAVKQELDLLRNRFEEELERQKIEALAEFAAGAGHEINNPLAIIGGHVQLLLREIENPEHRRHLAVIGAQVKRAYEMIADIRLFARPPKPQPERFELFGLLRKLFEEQIPLARESKIEMKLVFLTENGETNYADFDSQHSPHSEVPTLEIETDPVQLHVVLSMLCNNAREVQSMTGGEIRIEVRQQGTELEIAVEDAGPGVSEEVRELLFCPYFSGRQAGRGLGFGLPKAWRILRRLGASIRYEMPKSGRGSRFVVRFPSF